MVAYSKVVELPLKTSKKVVLLSAATYDTEFSLKLYVSTTICSAGQNRVDTSKTRSTTSKIGFQTAKRAP